MASKRARPGSERKLEKVSQDNLTSDEYVHVHCFVETGRWGAWVREPKRGGKRIYIGTHMTDRLAARCQDRALLKLETDPSMLQPINLNFDRKDYEEDEHLRNTLSRDEFFKLIRGESRATYNKIPRTKCLRKFLAQEQALGNLPTSEDFIVQNSMNTECMTESIGGSDDPLDHKNETDKEEDDEGNSPGEDLGFVVQQRSTSFQGATHDEIGYANDEQFASVASPAVSWNGKRKRTSEPLACDEKQAIEAMLVLSLATCESTCIP